MAISTYTELKTAVANWLGRSDLTDRIPEFITLAEAAIARLLRKQVTRAALTLNSDAVSLPAGATELRSVRLNTDTRKYPLYLTTPEGLASVRRVGSGVPNYAAVLDGVLLLDIDPDADYTAEISYFDTLTALSTGSPTNSTLTGSPDIYLFGALKEAEPYLEHDERVALWEAKFQKAIDDENNARERAELGGAPMVMRLPVVFG
jgi:hypothetical protein